MAGQERSVYDLPQSGKKRGKGNGVGPIKTELILSLASKGWKLEQALSIPPYRLGGLDASFQSSAGLVALEWETGNISSSHRALNKMALGLLKKILVAGTLIVPSRELYQLGLTQLVFQGGDSMDWSGTP